jgi:hypothetical protein
MNMILWIFIFVVVFSPLTDGTRSWSDLKRSRQVKCGAFADERDWCQKDYPVQVPDTLKSVSFILKDSKRIPETSGWG